MSKRKRISYFINGILLIAIALVLIFNRTFGYEVVAFSLGVVFMMYGLRELINYILLTRHMVGSQITLYQAFILIDLSFFIIFIVSKSRRLIVISLIAMLVIYIVIDFLRFLELAHLKNHFWTWRLLRCIINLLIVVFCIIFYSNDKMAAHFYALWIIIYGLEKIIDSFKSKVLVSIQQ